MKRHLDDIMLSLLEIAELQNRAKNMLAFILSISSTALYCYKHMSKTVKIEKCRIN